MSRKGPEYVAPREPPGPDHAEESGTVPLRSGFCLS